MLCAELLRSFFEELYEFGDVEVVAASGNKLFSLIVENHVVGLGVNAELFVREVRVDFAEAFEYLTRFGRDPFVLRQLLFVVGIKRDNDEIVAEQGQYFRIGPHPRFHFAAVDATVPRVVDEQRLVYFTGVGHRFVIVEETLQSVRQA